jgi:signal peptidase II
MNKRFLCLGLGVALSIMSLDQLTKWVILNHFIQDPRILPVTSFFNLLLNWNKGVSFGMFNSGAENTVMLLTILALLIISILAVWLWQVAAKLQAFALGFIMGGALGNVIDRMRFGSVIDFLDFHYGDYHWPAFNIADSAITIGVVFLLLDSWYFKSEALKKN